MSELEVDALILIQIERGNTAYKPLPEVAGHTEDLLPGRHHIATKSREGSRDYKKRIDKWNWEDNMKGNDTGGTFGEWLHPSLNKIVILRLYMKIDIRRRTRWSGFSHCGLCCEC